MRKMQQDRLNSIVRFMQKIEDSLRSYDHACWPTLSEDLGIDWLDDKPIYDHDDNPTGEAFTEDSLMRHVWRALQHIRRDPALKNRFKGQIDHALRNDVYAMRTFLMIMQTICDDNDLILYETKQIKVCCPECLGQSMVTKVPSGEPDDCPTCGLSGLILEEIPEISEFNMERKGTLALL